MRRLTFLVLASAVALSVVALTRGAGTVAPVEVAPAVAPSSRPEAPRVPVEPEAPLRNVFEYGAEPQARTVPAQARPRVPDWQAAPVAGTSDPIRFIGVVVRGGGLKAALVIEGDVVLLSPGESAKGYTLLTVDRDEGATLRNAVGDELRAPVAP